MTVNILGVDYEIIMRPADEHDPKLDDANGYTEPWSKKLVVEDFEPDVKTVENPDAFKKKVLRHEITHAFLHESGLRENSWGDNEEIVDWIALQGPKIYKAWQEAGALDPEGITIQVELDGEKIADAISRYSSGGIAP